MQFHPIDYGSYPPYPMACIDYGNSLLSYMFIMIQLSGSALSGPSEGSRAWSYRDKESASTLSLEVRRCECSHTVHFDAQVTCYPGGGTKYGAHVDNPDGDGREDGRKVRWQNVPCTEGNPTNIPCQSAFAQCTIHFLLL